MKKDIGDSHNYGRYVYLNENCRVFKPRPLYWEWLLLSSKGTLRQIVNELFKPSILDSPFKFIPTLEFYSEETLDKYGEVEKYDLESFEITKLDSDSGKALGSCIALFSWLGIADLHSDNIYINMTDKSIEILPFDIEALFNNFVLPSQSMLIPAASSDFCDYGLKKIVDEVKKINLRVEEFLLPVLSSYADTLSFLELNKEEIELTLSRDRFFYCTPVRVILRRTGTYRKSLQDSSLSCIDYLSEEILQLKNKDIPYFFRFMNSESINFYDNIELSSMRKLQNSSSLSNSIESLSPGLFRVNTIRCKRFDELLKNGILQIVTLLKDYVYHREFREYGCGELRLKFEDDLVICKYREGNPFGAKL